MRFWRSIVVQGLVLGLAALPAAAQETPATPPATPATPAPVVVPAPTLPAEPKSSIPQRRAWMFGVNYGYAGARFVGMGQAMIGELRSDTPDEYPPLVIGVPNWNGTDIESSPVLQLRFGYAINPSLAIGFERTAWSKDFEDYSWKFASSTLSATFYPGAGHLFVRGGAGVSTMAEKIPVTEPFFVQFSDRGLSLEGAVGYEFDFYKRISIAPEVSLRHMQYGDNIRAQIGAASLGFNWWF